MTVLVRIAFRNLIQARRRSMLLGGSIAMVTLFLILMLSLTKGMETSLVEAATTTSTGQVTVGGFFKPTSGSSIPVVTDKEAVRKVLEDALPNLDYIVERDRGWGKATSDSGTVQLGLSGLVPEQEGRFFKELQLAKECDYLDGGRDSVVGTLQDLNQPNTIVLFANQAKKLGVRVGDVVTFRTETFNGQTNTIDLRIVAVAKDLGLLSSWSAFVPKQAVIDLYQLNNDTTGAFWVYLKNIDDADEAMGRIREALAKAGYRVRDHESAPFWMKFESVQGEDFLGQEIDVTTWRDEVSFLTWILMGFNALSWLVVTILVAIIAIGIMNTMWNTVRERTREIGTMRAIGMGKTQVLMLFLVEALLLGLVSTSIGAVVGITLATGLTMAHIVMPSVAMQSILMTDTLHLVASPLAAVAAVVVLTILVGSAALLPSYRASRLQPVRALSSAE